MYSLDARPHLIRHLLRKCHLPLKGKAFALLLALLLLAGCGRADAPAKADFFAMDTVMSLTVYGGSDADLAALEARVNELEALFSRTREDSDISRLNSSSGEPVPLSEDARAVLTLAEEYRALTDGAFDVSVGALMDAWGFTKGADAYRVPSGAELAALLPLTGEGVYSVSGDEATLLKAGAVLDLGGVGKGYAGDELLKLLREQGHTSALLALGGNICCLGAKPDGGLWRVAVRHPADASAYAGYLSLSDSCAVTTGGYERYFESGGEVWRHVLDPATGYPAKSGLDSVTVVCESSAAADILSTAVYVLGEEAGLALRESLGGFELLLLTSDGRAVVTPGLADSFELDKNSGYEVEIRN